MSALGMDILSLAGSLIGFQTIYHSRWKANVLATDGTEQPTYYSPPVKCRASVQPMSRELLEKFGLDVQKDYHVVYSEADLRVADLERGRACDVIDFGCFRFNVESNTDWIDQNGWRASICCKIGLAP